MEHFTVTFKPEGGVISIHARATLLEAASQAGIVLNTICGGEGICRKCVVIVEPEGQEVLACQWRIHSDVTVTIPFESRFFEQKILTAEYTRFKVRPDIYKRYVTDTSAEVILGVAVDVGTTTVVAKLIDMVGGSAIAIAAGVNPQIRYGDDVVSRISYAQTDAKLTELREAIIGCVNKLTEELCEQASVEPQQIYEMCIVGNTTMNHIFLGLPIRQLGQAPYEAFSLEAHDMRPDESGLRINERANIHTVENIAGFVGGDTTAVALAVDIDSSHEMTLAIDIGTNGEVVLGTSEKLYAASCAAGPALEGARISRGSRAMAGAIEAVVVNEIDIDLDVIGGVAARSICGSGLIDAVAVLLDLGIIDSSGRFVKRQELQGRLSAAILSRMTQRQGQPAFVLARADEGEEQDVVLTQRDIRQMQLAKAAIRAGIRLLQKKIGIADSDIKQIYLAGAFGNYIRKESALRIGLLPDVPHERIAFVGNAAGAGAEMILISSQARKLANKLARKINYIEIAHEPDFTTVYTDSMLF